MDITHPNFTTTSIFFLFILLSGFWVSRSGQPYNGLIFNIHKLIGLTVGVYLIRIVHLTNQSVPLSGLQWAAIIVTALLFVVAVAAGGLLSILDTGGLKNLGSTMQSTIELAHKVMPYVIVVSTGLTVYLLLG